MDVREEHGWCALCRSRCGTVNTIAGDRLVGVAPDPGHPTGRAVCPKGRAAPEIAHSSRRLLRPLKRTRPKTDPDPGWREVSWDEALDDIAARLDGIRQESGAEAVAFALSSPSGTALSDSFDWILRFIRLFGSPNICDAMEICNWQKDHAHKFTFGVGMPTPEFSKSDLILLWGYNPANSWLAHSGAVAAAQAAGARVVVIDPKKSGHALQTPYWMRLRPGTDGVLALGLAHLLIESGGYDQDFVRRWTNGPLLVDRATGLFLRGADVGLAETPDCYVAWDEGDGGIVPYHPDLAVDPDEGRRLALHGRFDVRTGGRTLDCEPAFAIYARACAAYPPDRVAEITGLPPEDVHTLAGLIASSSRISYHAWTGIAQHAEATQTERAIALLYALTGCFDAEGGNVRLNRQPVNPVADLTMLDEGQRRKALGLADRPLGPPEMGQVTATDVYTAILEKRPYAVRALVAFGSNMLASRPEPERGRQALESLEFQVHVDLFMTPSAALADYVLPANSLWEREALRVGFEISAEAEERVQLRPRMVPPQGESRSDLWIVFQLARRLGLEKEFFGGDIEAAWNHVLEPLGLTTGALRASPGGVRRPVAQGYRKHADGAAGFPTQTRRVELYSELLARHGHPAVPQFGHGPEPSGRFPYLLTNGRQGYYCHSQHRSINSLRRRAPFPLVSLSAELAREKAIADGDWVLLLSPAGRAGFKAKIDPDLLPDVVVADYGWWQPNHDLALPGYPALGPETSNYNVLTPAGAIDPVSGAVSLRSTRCDVVLDRERSARDGSVPTAVYRVRGIRRETPDTVSVLLSPADREREDPDRRRSFVPGQHLTVACDIVGNRVRRSYSLSNRAADAGSGLYRITVKQMAAGGTDGRAAVRGVMSTHINTALAVGDLLTASGPDGVFRIPPAPDFPVVLVASGVGITPFLSYLETIADLEEPPEGALYYGSRNGAARIFGARLDELRQRLPGFRIVEYFSRPDATDLPGIGHHRRGRVSADGIDQRWIDRRARFYLCGPVAMLAEITDGLAARGVPRFEIFQEAFHTPQTAVETAPDAAHHVHFARSNIGATWTAGQGTVLDMADRLGVRLSAGCRVGQCESCLVRIVSGSVGHRVATGALGTAPEGGRWCLSCQAVPTGALVLDA
ncbi:anaerobic selenocysteine-containing dehydrogenase/ferredoxin-NADP reductase [Azospirillum lipoferum]|uniref:Molybdopterin-dependent oxidoreductase n=1 Tax=Azospirillum lipoferum TaxID=193 RepID=A0A5A9GGA0_AZOLI|nr:MULTISPECIES: molybdopterin-dependent oxidoreductase [Azospirillum]KAA0592714.1 molybdopterin-dependent oxidoreductase [Azospirillum lipoferum]MCP1614343.1 anaerobic selenocysteine-containing dehydrogenase/ferredoxin-NADP reductase [Azospirillum lipoferum]MDW5531879.1 molybdopterin-dependent oxidoreductase [Azospirillum sp. NL1]